MHRIRYPHAPARPAFGRWTVLALALTALACLVGWGLGQTELDSWFFVENGPIELVECGFLIAALLPMGLAAVKAEGWSALACLGFVAMIAIMIARETPRCSGPFAERGLCMADGYKDLAYAAAPLIAAALAACLKLPSMAGRGWPTPAALVRELLWVWPVAVTALLLVAAQAAEAGHVEEIEEMLELAAYLYLALLGLWAFRHVGALSAREAGSLGSPRPCLR